MPQFRFWLVQAAQHLRRQEVHLAAAVGLGAASVLSKDGAAALKRALADA